MCKKKFENRLKLSESEDAAQTKCRAPAPSQKMPSSRKHVWELDTRMHCSVLGTCLTIDDLKRVVHRLGLEVCNDITDYELHSVFVNAVASKNQISKLVDKALEKKFQRKLHRFRKCKSTEGIAALWQKEMENGDVAGAYWGIMSHPMLDDDLNKRAFGDVHMLSHVLGASRNTTRRQLAKTESMLVEKEQKLSLTKQVFRKRLRHRDARIDELQKELAALKGVERQLALAHEKIFSLRQAKGFSQIEKRVGELSLSLDREKKKYNIVDAALSRIGDGLAEKEIENRQLKQTLTSLKSENVALEQLLERTVGCSNENIQCEHIVTIGDHTLCGRKIMYVGGRDNLIPHYRQLVQTLGGDLIHHDGRMSQSIDGIKRSLDNVDIVVCPVDCVSHSACQQLKAACKHRAVPFVPLRSSGLSSLARGIQEYA